MLAVLIALLTAGPSPTPKPRPTPAPVLEGRVQGPDGKPIAGAIVVARSKTATWTDPPLSTTTDAAGSFRLPVKTGAAHDVWAHARGLAVAKREDVRPGPSLLLRLEHGGAIEGVVRNSSGAPVAGARVETEPNDRVPEWAAGAGTATATSDRNGRFRLTGLDRRPHSIAASARRYGRAGRENVLVGRRVELFLVPGGSVSGVVVDADGRALPDVAVRLEGIQPRRSVPSARTTDAKGRFGFDGLIGGTYALVARHPRFGVALSPGIEVGSEEDVRRDVILLPGVAVTGRLVDPDDLPVTGRIVVGEIAGEPAPRSVADALGSDSAADGRFRIEGVPLGPGALSVTAPGFAARRVDFDARPVPPGTDVGDVTMDPGLRLRGRVRARDGAPVSEAQLAGHQRFGPGTSLRAQGTSDENGAFVLGGLKPGRVYLWVRARGLATHSSEVEAGASDLDLVLDPAGAIAGTVVDDRGAAVPSFRVGAESGNYQGDTQDEFSPDDGRFLLESVAEGLWTVSVVAAGYGRAAVSDVVVRPGRVTDLGRVSLKRGASIRGQVVAFDDSPVPGATIQGFATQSMAVDMDGPTASSDAQGLFELRGVSPGSTTVTATHPSYAESQVRNVEADPTRTTEIKLVLGQGGRIEGTARRRDGAALVNAVVSARPRDGGFSFARSPVAPDGSFTLERVPAGPTSVTLMLGSGSRFSGAASREVDVRDGETSRVDLSVASILVSGRVSRADGVVAEARVTIRSRGSFYSVSEGGLALPAPASVGPERGTATTDEEGFYRLLVDGPGRTLAIVETGSSLSQHLFQDIEIPDADAFNLDFDLGSSVLSGTVVDAETNSAVAEASVSAQPRDGRGPRGANRTGPDGRFRLEVEPGEYRLSASRDGYTSASMDVSPGASGLSDILIALEKGVEIRGRLVDASGNGVPGTYVSATSTDSVGGVPTLADGNFRITGLKAAGHTLFAEAGRLGFATRTITAPADGVVLQLSPGGLVRIRVLAADGTPVDQATIQVTEVDGLPVEANESERTSADGLAELMTPSGVVTLSAWSSGEGAGRGRVVVTVPEGQTVPAEIVLQPSEKAAP